MNKPTDLTPHYIHAQIDDMNQTLDRMHEIKDAVPARKLTKYNEVIVILLEARDDLTRVLENYDVENIPQAESEVEVPS